MKRLLLVATLFIATATVTFSCDFLRDPDVPNRIVDGIHCDPSRK